MTVGKTVSAGLSERVFVGGKQSPSDLARDAAALLMERNSTHCHYKVTRSVATPRQVGLGDPKGSWQTMQHTVLKGEGRQDVNHIW